MFPAIAIAGGRPKIIVARTANYVQVGDIGGETSFSQSSVSLGSASPDRVICVGIFVGSRSNFFDQDVSSVTIAGVSATRAGRSLLPFDEGEASIWYASVPTGTTGTIVIGMADRAHIANVHVFAVKGPTTAPFATTVGGPTSNTSSAGSHSLSQNTEVGAGLVGIIGQHFIGNTQNGSALSWTGLGDALTATDSLNTGAGLLRVRGCSAYESELLTGSTPRTISAAWATPTSSSGTAFASMASVCVQFRAD
jgi:hypothetical protein